MRGILYGLLAFSSISLLSAQKGRHKTIKRCEQY